MDSFHQVINSFQAFERKLDKLQDDVSSHGYTLSELRSLMANLASEKAGASTSKNDSHKWPKKTIAVQYENEVVEGPFKPKKIIMKPMLGRKSRIVKPIARYPRDISPGQQLGLTKGVNRKFTSKTKKVEIPKKPGNLRDHRFEKKQKPKVELSLSA